MTEHAIDFSHVTGVAVPLPIDNLDTDQIMPKQFLLGTDKSDLARGLLYDLRFDADGSRRQDCILNTDPYAHARVLVGGANFGCGSSREHAVWGLLQWGIAVVLASSFAEIFYYNAINNRLLVVTLDAGHIDAIIAEVSDPAHSQVTVDVEHEVVRTASGHSYPFTLNARQRRMYLDGVDVVGASLQHLTEIEAFERRWRDEAPWTHVLPPVLPPHARLSTQEPSA